MTSQLSEYKPGIEIHANVSNHPEQASFTGWIVIIDKTRGEHVADSRVTPKWAKPANTPEEACRILIQFGRDVLEGRATGGDFVNNG
ncbi:hypothetical protein [Paraburkholderia lycopersici]|uniref:Uncharacterized protein n=1 Tax=Paraburkholderia lycopersici TaxID=416944 RepID=A0A1G6TFR5_9BURK|nr:hypothetical protein [Paraburkholderia lycopersici]SDD27869.1 hypothetical protein SAMN05421548_11724 [Paraburkholderia lycopersici]